MFEQSLLMQPVNLLVSVLASHADYREIEFHPALIFSCLQTLEGLFQFFSPKKTSFCFSRSLASQKTLFEPINPFMIFRHCAILKKSDFFHQFSFCFLLAKAFFRRKSALLDIL